MKSSLTQIPIFTLVLSLIAGCASVNVSTEGNKDMVVVNNSGCFLFGCMPLFSGDPDYPNQDVCNWFDDTVKLETNVRLLEEEVERRGAGGVRNLTSHRYEETVFPLIIKRKVYQTSAELIRN